VEMARIRDQGVIYIIKAMDSQSLLAQTTSLYDKFFVVIKH